MLLFLNKSTYSRVFLSFCGLSGVSIIRGNIIPNQPRQSGFWCTSSEIRPLVWNSNHEFSEHEFVILLGIIWHSVPMYRALQGTCYGTVYIVSTLELKLKRLVMWLVTQFPLLSMLWGTESKCRFFTLLEEQRRLKFHRCDPTYICRHFWETSCAVFWYSSVHFSFFVFTWHSFVWNSTGIT